MFTRLLTGAVTKAKHLPLPRQGPVKSVKSALARITNRTTLSVLSQAPFPIHRGYAKKSKSRPRACVDVPVEPAGANLTVQEAETKGTCNILRNLLMWTESFRANQLFFEREIDWIEEQGKPPRKLLFRVTSTGVGDFDPTRSLIWAIGGEKIPAPFFNREDVLLEMLEAQYHNMNLGSQKPKYSTQMMSPGSGKTRILIEWIVQAFNNPRVISKFLENGQFTQDRKSFLNALYWSAYKQYNIISIGEDWELESLSRRSMASATVDIIRDTILLRHQGQSISFDGKLIHITDSSAERYFGLPKEVNRFIRLFLSLADITYESPSPDSLPFPNAGLPPIKTFVFFSIDECQGISDQFPGQDNKDPVYLLFKGVAARTASLVDQGIVPFWFAVGTNLPGTFFNLEGQRAYFNIIISSLPNLLNINYLANICEEFFAFKLPKKYYKSKSTLPELPVKAAEAIVRNYLKTFGNPRAVELFVKAGIIAINEHVRGPGSAEQVLRMHQLDNQLGKEHQKVFHDLTLNGSAEDIERLDIAAALCSAMDYDKPVPGLNVSPKQLSTDSYLTIWKREAVDKVNSGLIKFYMTRPFFTLDAVKLLKELEMLRCKPEAAKSQHWKPEIISQSSLVLQKDCADYLLPSNNLKGKVFEIEIAVASTLYARYKLTEKEHVLLKDIFPAKHLPADLLEATVKLNGVVRLKKQVNATSCAVFDEIQKNQVISIDIGNSKFADVMVPISIKGQTTILAFQCKQYATKPPLPDIVANCLTVIDQRGYYYVAINPIQNDNTEFQDCLAKKATNQTPEFVKDHSFLAEAKELLSPLYLVGMDFVPHEFTTTA